MRPRRWMGGMGGMVYVRIVKLTPLVLCNSKQYRMVNWAEPCVGRDGTVQALLQLLLPTTRTEVQVGEILTSLIYRGKYLQQLIIWPRHSNSALAFRTGMKRGSARCEILLLVFSFQVLNEWVAHCNPLHGWLVNLQPASDPKGGVEGIACGTSPFLGAAAGSPYIVFKLTFSYSFMLRIYIYSASCKIQGYWSHKIM